MSPTKPSSRGSALWVALPQVVTRLTSFYVFAAVARGVGAQLLGALTLGVAIGGIAVPLAPAVVGKPLASAVDAAQRLEFGRLGTSAAVWASVVAAAALTPAAVLTHGLTRVALIGGIIGLPTVMIVEATFWRAVFVADRRSAALWYSSAYVVQAALVTACVPLLSGSALVIASFVALALPAAVLVVRTFDLSPRAALEWMMVHRSLWLPYVIGTIAALAVVQAIPVVLSAASSYEDAGVYRAAELAFGGTNLLIGVTIQALLTQDVRRPRRTYLMVSAALVVVAVSNGLVLRALPTSLLHFVFGATAPLLVGVLLIVTVQRAALSVSTVGSILLVPRLSARTAGLLDVVSAGMSFVALIVGAVSYGLRGALVGLAVAEVLIAAVAAYLLRRRT